MHNKSLKQNHFWFVFISELLLKWVLKKMEFEYEIGFCQKYFHLKPVCAYCQSRTHIHTQTHTTNHFVYENSSVCIEMSHVRKFLKHTTVIRCKKKISHELWSSYQTANWILIIFLNWLFANYFEIDLVEFDKLRLENSVNTEKIEIGFIKP